MPDARVEAAPGDSFTLCRHASRCGGCTSLQVAYPRQLQLKTAQLEALLAGALGSRTPPVLPMLPSPAVRGFRTKASFVFGQDGRRLVMGHYEAGSRRIVPVDECPVHADAANLAAFTVREALKAAHVEAAGDRLDGVARHVVVRVSRQSGEVMVTLVVTRNAPRLKAVTKALVGDAARIDSLHLNIHDRPGSLLFGPETRKLHGRERLREQVAGISFLISPTSFFQTNIGAAERMVAHVLDLVPGESGSRVLDLYSGAGLFSLPLARRGHRVLAVEESAEAVADGEASRQFSRIEEGACRFVRGRVEQALARAEREHARTPFSAVVMDPPRDGCSESVIQSVFNRMRPARVVYVSCNPEALARDLASAARAGYEIDPVQPLDMFPHTPHIEAIAALRLTR
jgi:23S rRNA (uracil1939-C5)-methyltransferase